ncbi:MAG TPA: DUF4340 domain-containing protein [Vicinamibacterales bacterium]|nr:DUF4340 domain-containing protein [Vicinamibacterales bacterium]
MRSFKPLAILALVLAALVAYIYFVQSRKPSEAEAEARPKVFEVAPEQIVELMVRSGNDRTLVRKAGGAWRVVEPVDAKADEAEVTEIASSLASLENVRVVEEAPSDLEQFGLSSPGLEVGFRVEGDETWRHLRVGDKTATQGELYASRGGKQVFLIPAYLETSFAKGTFDLRDKSILTFERGKVDRMAVEGAGSRIVLAKTGSTWTLTSPVQAPADEGAVEGLIGRLETARMNSIAAQEAEAARKFGLDKPTRTVTLGMGSSQASLLVGSKADEAAYYARDLSRPLVFVIDASLVDELGKPADDLRNKDVFAFRPFNVTLIELTLGTDVLAFEKGAGGENAGEQWRRVKPAAGDVDRAKLDDLLAKLSNLRAESFQPPASAAAKALSSPTLVAAARFGEAGTPETVSFARVGDDVYAAIPGQPGAAKVPAGDFEDLVKAIDALK